MLYVFPSLEEVPCTLFSGDKRRLNLQFVVFFLSPLWASQKCDEMFEGKRFFKEVQYLTLKTEVTPGYLLFAPIDFRLRDSTF